MPEDYFNHRPWPPLTYADVLEMIDLYRYFGGTEYPLTHDDLAFMFNCSPADVKKVFRGAHPEQKKRKDGKIVPPVESNETRGRKKITHCSAGHMLTDDNLRRTRNGEITRNCVICYEEKLKLKRKKKV